MQPAAALCIVELSSMLVKRRPMLPMIKCGPQVAAPVAAILLLATLAAPVVALAASADAPSNATTLVERGKYLTTAGDCVSCHTTPGGKLMAGGKALKTPFGEIYPPNITPDRDTGIGGWSDAQFYRALHEGIDDQGHYLYPALPFPWYTKVTRDDVTAIRAYLASIPPVHQKNRPNGMAFPFDIRQGLVAWRAAFFTAGTFQADPAKSAELNRGAYMVQGLGHCGECHNQQRLFGATKAAGRLQGGAIDDWYAPNITNDNLQGIGGWSQPALATYLKTGVSPTGATALGPMAETIHNSLRYLNDPDIQAIAAYLKSTAGNPTYTETKPVSLAADADAYLNHCAFCHQQNGEGTAGKIPALAGSGMARAQGAQDVIRVILGGVPATGTFAPMPAVGAGMTDAQVADAANYIRTSWGNGAPANASAGDVARLRGETHTVLTADKSACAVPTADALPGVAAQLKGTTEANLMQSATAIVPKARQAAPRAATADLVNRLTVEYCATLIADGELTDAQRAARLGSFADIVYGRLSRGAAEE
jgi:mono/diheme cytochrome c family protein